MVVGNNTGNSDQVKLESLQNAERDARRLRDQLVRHAQFDNVRVRLITGGGRAAILDAARDLAGQRRADQEVLGPVPTLFALFFTGHGWSGELLTADEALGGEQIGAIFDQVGATLNLGVFDACYAGSLESRALLQSKGARPLSPFDPNEALPAEVLNAEGSMWLVSSSADELSFEDPELGGLFSHYFIEAFTAARSDEVGISLEAMWEYARRHTARHASAHGVKQTPQKVIKLTAWGPVYFSFPPKRRTATLRLDDGVGGEFVVDNRVGLFATRVIKEKGAAPIEVPLVLGDMSIRDADSPDSPAHRVDVPPGTTLRLRVDDDNNDTTSKPSALGYCERALGRIGSAELTRDVSCSRWWVSGGYQFLLAPGDSLAATHRGVLGVGLVRGALSTELGLTFSMRDDSHAAWSQNTREVGALAWIGLGLELAATRLDLQGGVVATKGWTEYESGEKRSPWGVWVGAGLRWLVALPRNDPWLTLSARAALGARFSESVILGDHVLYGSVAPLLGVQVGVPF